MARQDLANTLTAEPVLQLYNTNAGREVHADDSGSGLTGRLLQAGQHGIAQPVTTIFYSVSLDIYTWTCPRFKS